MSFADFSDQGQVVQLLQRSLARGRLGHAYLFIGPRLEELEGVARTLAKALNCALPVLWEGIAIDSCDQCLSCRKIDHDNHGDIQWLRPEAKSRVITIDQIRDLMQTIYLKPTEAQFKVAMIVAADRLNTQAANAFLKTLEEPPARSIVVLLTNSPERVLETIVSRCLRLKFAGESGVHFDKRIGEWLKTFAELAAKDQKDLFGRYRLLAAIQAHLTNLKAGTEKELSARSPLERYDDIDPKLREKWEDELEAAIEAEYRRLRGDVILAIQLWMRDVWLHTLRMGKEILQLADLSALSENVGRRISPDDAMENLRVLEQLQRLFGGNVQEALALEVCLLKLKL